MGHSRDVAPLASRLHPGEVAGVRARGVRFMPARLNIISVDGPEVRFGTDELLPYVSPGTPVTIYEPHSRRRIKGVSVFAGLSMLVVLCEPIW